MVPPKRGAAQRIVHTSRRQEHLRNCCKLGDLTEVALALKPQASTWWTYAQKLLSYLSTSQGRPSLNEPADLSWVYEDDIGNMPIHYIALGSKPTLTSTVMALFCARPTAAPVSDAKRAELLRWLLDNRHALDLSVVNAHLQTPAHCAVQSRSLQVLEVLLTYTPANGAQRLPAGITPRDSKEMQPLDLALVTQQWPAVRLLINAGALQASPALAQVQRELRQVLLLPDSRRHSGAFHVLKGALGKAVGLMWKQGRASSGLPPSQPPGEATRLLGASSASLGPQYGTDEEAAESRVVVLSSPQQVYQHRQASIQTLAHVLNIRETAAHQKLEAHQWDLIASLETLANDTSGEDMHSSSTGRIADQAMPEQCGHVLRPCTVCYEQTLPSAASIPCPHHTCDECLKGILLASMDEGNLGRCACPMPDCRSRMPELAAQQLLSSRQLEQYLHLATQAYIDRNPLMQWCPRAGCGQCVALNTQGVSHDSRAAAAGRRRAVDVQCSCGERFCLCCSAAAHEPAPCAAVRDWHEILRQAKKMAASQSESWLTANTKPCTGCGAPIQKNGGCNHITCSRCHGHFCWACGVDWDAHSSATGGYYACNRFRPAASSGKAAEGPAGIRSLFDSLYGLYGWVQDAAQQYRLEHYLRRYHAQECDERLLHLSADWIAALLSSGRPATGCHTAGVGLKQLLNPADPEHTGHDVREAHVAPAPENDYTYLSQAAAEVVSGRKVLANSYIAAYAMPRGDSRRHFEDTQGRLEAAVEQCSLPLALMPHIQAVSEAAAQHAKAKGGEAPIRGSLNKLPLDIAEGGVIRQQAFHALAVHSMADQLRNLIGVVVAEKNALFRMAREGS